MKKVISVILVMLMVLTVLPFTTLAADGSRETISDWNSLESVKLDDKTPCYGDYEILVDENAYSPMAADKKDQYESNNSFSVATRLNSQPIGQPSNFTKNISATLHRESWLWGLIQRNVDEDYYRLDVFGNALVSISLTNIPSGCDYDIKLFQYDNIKYAGEDDISQIASSTRASNNDENIYKTLTPGTYYLWIYSYNDECSDSDYYNLSVSVSYTAQNVTISSLRFNKGAKAALWVSDYDPCGIKPYSSLSKEEVGVVSTETQTFNLAFQNPYTEYFKGSSGVEHAVLYVWDKEFRVQLRNALGTYYTQLANAVNSDKELMAKVEHVESVVGGVTTITGIVITVCLASNPATIIASVVLAVTPTIFGVVADAFLPEGDWITTRQGILNYITNLRTALEANSQTSDNEVVRIATKYTYSKHKYPLISVTSHYFDFTPTMQSQYLYDSDIITAWNSNSVVNGTIYGIVGSDDMKNAINRVYYYLPDVNTGGLKNIYVNSSIPGELYIGEYHWYKFTAPSTGTYSFYTENSFDTTGELFSSVVPARSTTGLLAQDDDSGFGLNFKITYTLTAGQTVYLRVRGYNWTRYGSYSVRVAKES